MNKKHIITISGKLGSGKSSTAKIVANTLSYEHFSTGVFMRVMAEKRGISLEELSKMAENDPSIDFEIDNYCRSLGERENIVVDSRLGFHFIPESFKVFLELDPEVASRRILEDKKNNPNRHTEANGSFDTPEKIKEKIILRLESERKRYKELYGIEDQTDHKHFDLVIDTKDTPLEEVAGIVINKYKEWLIK